MELIKSTPANGTLRYFQIDTTDDELAIRLLTLALGRTRQPYLTKMAGGRCLVEFTSSQADAERLLEDARRV